MASTKEAPEQQLTHRQEAFIQEYLIDLNTTKAAIRAGYKETSAPTYGADLLRNPLVSQRIATAMAQRETRVKMTQDQVLHEMSLLSNSRVDWFVVDDDGQVLCTDKAPEGAIGAIKSIKRKITIRTEPKTNVSIKTIDVEITLWDKPAPLKLMGRHVGLFPDKVELTGPNGGPIETVTKIERVVVRADAQK